jgi:aerobic-type carbon monoxide dehydrogenase small subunit (CoxS/CutS family)
MDSQHLRHLLAKRHSHRDWNILYTGMYVDDGELQCPYCGCDFLRDAVSMLDRKMAVFDEKMMQEKHDKSRTRAN